MARKRLSPAKPKFLDQQHGAGEDAPSLGARAALSPSAPIAQVAAEASASSALRDLADDVARARADGMMLLEIPLHEIAPDHLARDRIAADDEDMASLMASIQAHGQRTPIEVTELAEPSHGFRYGLISGWRRLSALENLSQDDAERFGVVLALLRRPKDAADAYVAMVEENEIRVGLSYYERARVAVQAVERGVFETEKQALLTLFATASRAKRSRIRVFTKIHHALGDVLRFPSAIPERLGLALAEYLKGEPSHASKARKALGAEGAATAEAELACLTRVVGSNKPKPKARGIQNVPRAEHLNQALPGGITIRRKAGRIEISGEGASEALYQRLVDFLDV